MERIYPVFVLEENFNEETIEYSQAIDWCYNNLLHNNVFILNYDDLYCLQYKSQVLNIINEENCSMLQIGEDDWVIKNEIKTNISNKLKKYLEEEVCDKVIKLSNRLLELLELSVNTNKNIYFLF